MEKETLLIQRKDRVCTLVLNRPEKRNALTPEMLFKLHDVLVELAREDTIRTVVITGAGGRAFCSGYDMAALPTNIDSNQEDQELKGQNPFELAMNAVQSYSYPVIAMLNGYAFGGGCDLAVSCDIRVGADDIQIGMVPAKLGLVYSAEGLKRFVQTIGLARTKEIFFTGRRYNAVEAKELGLLNHIVRGAELESFTYTLAQEISQNAPLSLKGIKRILNLISSSGELGDRDRQEADELFIKALCSEDLKEGQKAFLEKTKPVFTGK